MVSLTHYSRLLMGQLRRQNADGTIPLFRPSTEQSGNSDHTLRGEAEPIKLSKGDHSQIQYCINRQDTSGLEKIFGEDNDSEVCAQVP